MRLLCIPKQLEKLVFRLRQSPGVRRSQRGSYCINTDLFAIDRTAGAFARPKNQFFKLFGYITSFSLILLLGALAGCGKYYLSVCQQWIDVRYLASTQAKTPDPRQDHPPQGQMIAIDWRVPNSIFKKKPEVVLDLIFWDYTTKTVCFPIEHRMGYVTYSLLDEDYLKTGGILTYKVEIVTEDGDIYEEWKHQLWVNLITIEDDNG
ncbi:MAG TPA: hypothetical protein VJ112_02325 [Rhabdochlamydiaceae bacterium]|nr:hypothetical protein [Rhabdochlamydiaceae bacterium]